MSKNSPSNLLAGVASTMITPAVGSPMSGFAGRGTATSIHDDLYATALVVRQISEKPELERTLVIIACDLLFLARTRVEEIRRSICDAHGISPESVLIASSHNHFGPVVDDRGETIVSESSRLTTNYLEWLVDVLTGIVGTALRQVQPCVLKIANGEARIGINRREWTEQGIILGQNPSGPMNPRVGVLRIDSTCGKPIAVIVNHACHGVSLAHSCTELSADFPGVMRDVVREATGAEPLFLQGAAGDINPIYMSWDWANPKRLGLSLGAEVVNVYYEAVEVPCDGSRMIVEERILTLPGKLPLSVDDARAEIDRIRAELADAETAGDKGEIYWASARLERVHQGLDILEGRAEAKTITAPITAVGITETIGIVTAPGEVFTDIGSDIVRQSPFEFTIYSGYTNGSINYVPTREAYTEGGYEVTHACQIAPEGGEILAAESISLLHAVHSEMGSR